MPSQAPATGGPGAFQWCLGCALAPAWRAAQPLLSLLPTAQPAQCEQFHFMGVLLHPCAATWGLAEHFGLVCGCLQHGSGVSIGERGPMHNSV